MNRAGTNAHDLLEVVPNSADFELIDGHVHPMNRAPDGTMHYDPAPVEAVLHKQGIGLAVVMIDGPLHQQRSRVGGMVAKHKWMVPVAWVRPDVDSINELEGLLASGFRGLKFHPTVDNFDADDPIMDPFMELAAQYRVPVQIHSAMDDQSRPERLAALARRHPDVPVIVVHFELGNVQKAGVIEIVKRVPNLFGETSWTNPSSILEAFRILGSDRMLFGTDATVDGYDHFHRNSIPDPHGRFVYNYPAVVAEVKKHASPEDFANWTRNTVQRLYRLKVVHPASVY